MRITEVKTHAFLMDVSWATETLIANPMSIYPKFKEKRSSWYGRQWAMVVEIKTDDNITGYGYIGGASRGSLDAIEDQFKIFLEGADPFATELIWEQCFRASQYYGRKGAALSAISGIDIALWDIKGKALEKPVYELIGGKTKDRLRAYATGIYTERHKKMGFRDVKIPVRYGPADGKEGLKKNEEDIKKTRELIGPDGDLMLDCYMALDVPYTIQLAKVARQYGVKWIEEPVLPDKIDSYRRIKDAVPDIMITGGEHEFTRYGFKELLEKQAVDLIQPDIYRAGGISEVMKIAAMSSAFDIPIILHGIGAPAYHFEMATPHSPMAEYWDVYASGGEPVFIHEPTIEDGHVVFNDRPGFGYELNPKVLAGARPAPQW
jgi:L-alanine-DL-glutamate epimerase-like enolase superfamily enzyme